MFPPADSSQTERLWVHNRGNGPVSIDTLTVDGPFEVDAASTIIPPRDSVEVAVTFSSDGEPGTYTGVLTVATAQSDAALPRVEVQLSATLLVSLSEDRDAPALHLSSSAPNPVTTTARIAYGVDTYGPLRLDLFDVTGRRVVTLVNQDHPPGSYTVEIDGRRLPPAVYLCRLTSGRQTVARMLVVTR